MMTPPARGITDADLMAYLDGSVAPTRAAEIEAALDADAEARLRLAEWRQQNTLITNLYRPAASEPLPRRMDVRRMAAEQDVSRQAWQRVAAAAVICLAIGAAGGWYAGRPGDATGGGSMPGLMADALAAHRLYAEEVVHPVEVSGNPGGELGTWLSKRLGRTLVIPNLETAGWTLVGGSLLPAGDKPAAQIMYEDFQGRRLTLFLTPVTSRADNAPRFAADGGLDIMSWADASINCTIVAPIEREEIKRIAAEVYDQLS